jgi:hypothetical protein
MKRFINWLLATWHDAQRRIDCECPRFAIEDGCPDCGRDPLMEQW